MTTTLTAVLSDTHEDVDDGEKVNTYTALAPVHTDFAEISRQTRVALHQRRIKTFDLPAFDLADLKICLRLWGALIPPYEMESYLEDARNLLIVVFDLLSHKASTDMWGFPTAWAGDPVLSQLLQSRRSEEALIKDLISTLKLYIFPFSHNPVAYEFVSQIIEAEGVYAELVKNPDVTRSSSGASQVGSFDAVFGKGNRL